MSCSWTLHGTYILLSIFRCYIYITYIYIAPYITVHIIVHSDPTVQFVQLDPIKIHKALQATNYVDAMLLQLYV